MRVIWYNTKVFVFFDFFNFLRLARSTVECWDHSVMHLIHKNISGTIAKYLRQHDTCHPKYFSRQIFFQKVTRVIQKCQTRTFNIFQTIDELGNVARLSGPKF